MSEKGSHDHLAGLLPYYIPSDHSVLCRLTIRLPDGSTLTKADAGGYAGMSDQGDDDKSGYSDAFKRAAVKLGVARYLYRDGVPEFVRERAAGEDLSAGEPQPTISSASPAPSPEPSGRPHRQADRPSRSGLVNGNGNGGGVVGTPPRSGRALFAWVVRRAA